MPGPDQTDSRTLFHISYCQHCDTRDTVPLVESSLERHPWRITWRCTTCSRTASAIVPPGLLPELRKFDVAGGTRISAREVNQFVANLDRLDQAADEL